MSPTSAPQPRHISHEPLRSGAYVHLKKYAALRCSRFIRTALEPVKRTSIQAGQKGFTLVELIVVIMLVGILATTFYVFFNDSLSQYLSLQKDGSEFTDLASQSQRIGNVMRGITDIVSETNSDIVCYAYFAPNNTYVSQIHYYLNASKTQLLADVTPMTANPPIGSLLTAQKKTFVIINDFYQSPSVNLFNYLDDSGAVMTLPVGDEHAIKGMQVNLAVQGSHSSDQAVSLQVSFRNRKTNL